jgi:hypothetical protein
MTTGSLAASTFTAQYETVRAWAGARPRPSLCPAGAAVLLQQGVAAWLRAWPIWRPVSSHEPDEPGAPRGPTAPRMVLTERTRALAGVLATMIEHCQQQQEERP